MSQAQPHFLYTSDAALGGTLHAWRDRLAPADVGLSNARRRWACGVRRQQPSAIAGPSADYLVRKIHDGDRITKISSGFVHFSPAGFGAYATLKSSSNTTIPILANELGSRGIIANTVKAGPTAAATTPSPGSRRFV